MTDLNDLEITQLCAEAMYGGCIEFGPGANTMGGYEESGTVILVAHGKEKSCQTPYDPLHDDAQAMALVKKFGMELMPPLGRANRDWRASIGEDGLCSDAHHLDLNRAICECVAKMQAAK